MEHTSNCTGIVEFYFLTSLTGSFYIGKTSASTLYTNAAVYRAVAFTFSVTFIFITVCSKVNYSLIFLTKSIRNVNDIC